MMMTMMMNVIVMMMIMLTDVDLQEAMDMLKSSIPLKNEVYGDYSEVVSDTYKLMASIHLAEGSIEKSLRCYKKVS